MAKRKDGKVQDQVNTLADALTAQADLPPHSREVQFAPMRKWAFDIAWPDLMVAVEYEGATWAMGHHNTGAVFHDNVLKYNEAAVLGWCVIRITSDMLREFTFYSPILRAVAAAQAVRDLT